MDPETISSLVSVAASRLAVLKAEFEELRPAADYMQQLLDLIYQHPLLREEWELFLVRAELPQPEFA